MRKYYIISAFCVLSALSGVAQDTTHYLIRSNPDFSGQGGVMFEVTQIRNQPIYQFGGGGGMLVDHKVLLGGFGMGNVVDDPIYTYRNTPVTLEMGYGGLWLGYLHQSHRAVHFNVTSRFAWGGMALVDSTNTTLLDDDFFMISPQVEMEFNVLPYMKLNVAGGYKMALGVNNNFFAPADFNAPFVLLGCYFGWFERS